jgi:hypothetical protein
VKACILFSIYVLIVLSESCHHHQRSGKWRTAAAQQQHLPLPISAFLEAYFTIHYLCLNVK